jgi:uncharacterized membrane protein
MSTTFLPQAPGASTAKTTGILSIVLGLLCLPVGLILAIIALVQHNKAKGACLANPGMYEPVGNTGLVTAIIGLILPLVLAIIGIIAAIAIPALLGQRGRARDRASMSNMTSAVGDLVGEYDRLVENRTPRESVPTALETKLRAIGADTKNPWDPTVPAFTYTIEVVDGVDRDSLTSLVQSRATQKGVSVFMITLPDASRAQRGYLAGAVLLQAPVNGSPVRFKVVELD